MKPVIIKGKRPEVESDECQPRRRLTKLEGVILLEMHSAGQTCCELAGRFGISENSVWRRIKRSQDPSHNGGNYSRFNSEVMADAFAKYVKGETLQKLASEIGVVKKTLIKHFRDNGYPVSWNGEITEKAKTRASMEKMDAGSIQALSNKLLSMKL